MKQVQIYKGSNSNNILRKLHRWRRYAIFAVEYYLFEKTRGLDFTMRDLQRAENADQSTHGYSKTNERHLKEIFSRLPFLEALKLIDVGCGKGVVLKEAVKYPFEKITGIDLNPKLIEIANRNFRKLHLEDKVTCDEKNALEYEDYGNYNVFFLFNPFDEEVLEQVVEKIIQETRKKQRHIYFIYHNPVFAKIFDEKSIFILQYKFFDRLKQYETFIYEGIF